MDSNAIFAILLLIAGLAILIAEVFVPSGGLLGVATFFTLLISLVCAYNAWGTSHPNIFYAFLVMLLLLVPTTIGIGFYVLPRTSLGQRVLLEGPEAQLLTPFAKETGRLQLLIGKFGSTQTLLNPGGLVRVDGERLHAVSEGLPIEPKESVQVVDVQGTRVVVRPCTPPAVTTHESPTHESPTASPAEASSRLDFDFPPLS